MVKIVSAASVAVGVTASAFGIQLLIQSTQRGRPPVIVLSTVLTLLAALVFTYAAADALRTGKVKFGVIMIVPALVLLRLLLEHFAG